MHGFCMIHQCLHVLHVVNMTRTLSLNVHYSYLQSHILFRHALNIIKLEIFSGIGLEYIMTD